MSEARIRTSLASAPSTPNSEEAEARRQHIEAEAWRRHGIVLIKIDDFRLPQTFRDLCEAVGIRRFGKREA